MHGLCFISDIPNSDSESFNPILWEEQRKQRAQVAFECDEDKDERETPPRVSDTFVTVCRIGKGKNNGAGATYRNCKAIVVIFISEALLCSTSPIV